MQTTVRSISLLLLLFVSPLLGFRSTVAQHDAGQPADSRDEARKCGNGITDSGEACDDGGLCIGGANAGTTCSDEARCVGAGVCVGGRDDLRGCLSDVQCRDGALCRHCKPFGGDGCASSCTVEIDLPFALNVFSQSSIHGPFLNVGLPLSGSEVFTVGGADPNGRSPVVVRTTSVNRTRADVRGLACACPRAATVMTCGGTLYDALGKASRNCTPDFAGAELCPAEAACAPLHGPGNAASGYLGCADSGVDVELSHDCNGDFNQPPFDRQVSFIPSAATAQPGRGTAFLVSNEALVFSDGDCSRVASEFGADGQFCTDDDPVGSRGTPRPIFYTTQTVTGVVHNPGDFVGDRIGPDPDTGSRYACTTASPGTELVGISSLCDRPAIDDDVTIYRLASSGFRVPAASPTSTATGGATPTPRPTSCEGDFNGDNQVTVDEIVTAVVNALNGCAAVPICKGDSNGDHAVTVDEIVKAVINALNGCPPSVATPTATPTLLQTMPSDQSLYSLEGTTAGEFFGGFLLNGEFLSRAVAALGDINGDGYGDMIAGAPGFDGAAGAKVDSGMVRVISGATRTILFTIEGQNAGDRFGGSVSATGDFNGDGTNDFVVGAPNFTGAAGRNSGKAYVFSGLDASTLAAPEGSVGGAWYGFSVGDGGEVHGSSPLKHKVVVGSPSLRVDVLSSGGETLVISTPTRDLSFGYSVYSAGDYDGDGIDDIAVGSPNPQQVGPEERVYIFNATTGIQVAEIVGEGPDDHFGGSVHGIADVTGDGLPDVIVGAPYHEGNEAEFGNLVGKVYIFGFNGAGAPSFSLVGENNSDYFGASVSSAGDFNADGFPDLVIGSPYFAGAAGPATGKIYVYSPTGGGLIETREGESARSRFGFSVGGGVDFGGDATADIVVGTYGYFGVAGANSGKIYVYSDKTP